MKKILSLFLFSSILCLSIAVSAQDRTITGKVTDGKEGVPGATVIVKGTNQGAAADIEGNYSLSNVSSGAVLVFSAVGFTAKEVTVGASNVINVTLAADVTTLQEVKVTTAAGIVRGTRKLGYSVGRVGDEDLNRAQNTNVVNALSGKVSGVQITSSGGTVGGSTRIVIRGGSSLAGNNQALVVVDGIPIDNSSFATTSRLAGADPGSAINDINPNDIESITVLKGPAASVLYGSRAANGVLVITTKKGKDAASKAKMSVTYNLSTQFERPLRLPDYQNVYGEGDSGTPLVDNGSNWGPKAEGQLTDNPDFQLNGLGPEKIPYVTYPDNVKDFFKTGVTMNHNLSFAGGNDNNSFRLSLGQLNNKGIYPNTEFKRTNVSINASAKLANKLNASGGINFVRSGATNRGIQGQDRASIGWNFLYLPRTINLTDWQNYTLPDDLNKERNFGTFFDNPYWTLNKNTYEDKRDRITGNIQLTYSPTSWVNIVGRAGTDFYSDRRKQVFAVGSLGNPTGSFFEDVYFVREITTDVIATFTKDISKDFSFTGIVGHNFRQRDVENNFVQATVLSVPDIYNISNATTTIPTDSYAKRRLYGVYSDLTFGYKGFLFLNLTGRNDWSSTLPKENRSYFYPGINGTFIFTDAFEGLKGNKWVNFGKVRVSYAKTGNDADPYLLETYAIRPTAFEPFNLGAGVGGITFPFKSTPGATISNVIGNPNIKNESLSSTEVGGEFKFINNRIGLDVTWYEAKATDFIFNVQIAPSSGYTTQVLNAGKTRTRGVEVGLNVSPLKSKDFTWDINTNYTKYNRIVLELKDDLKQLSLGQTFTVAAIQARPGEVYGVIFGLDYKRDPQGRIVVDGNGAPLLDPNPKIVGNTQPDFQLGITNAFKYKNFSMSFLFDARFGGDIYSNTIATLRYSGSVKETLPGREVGDEFIVDGVFEVQPGVFVPNTTPISSQTFWQDSSSPFRTASQGVFDGTFVKLREVRFGYSLPSRLLDKTPFGAIDFAVIGRNLWMYAPFIPHIDPETSLTGNGNAQGFEYGNLMTTRSYGFDVRVTF